MKKLLLVLVFILAACLFLSACGEVPAPSPSPIVTNAETPTLTPAAATEPTSEKEEEFDYRKIDEVNAYLKKYYSLQIEDANKYRVTADGTEYFLDTDCFVEIDPYVEFPLYRNRDGKHPEYLGTTGFAFQVFGDYIYVQSDPLQEDWPDGVLTRVVDLNDLSITTLGRNIDISIPQNGSKVYYTIDAECAIYIAEASLENPEKLIIEIPDKQAVDEKVKESYEYDISDLVELVRITSIEDNWIYFNYLMFEPEGGIYYDGNYCIKTDGSEIQKDGEGKFDPYD